jgi:hypothetical protein
MQRESPGAKDWCESIRSTGRSLVNLEESTYTGVFLRNFSPEEPALSEVEGISRAPPQSS